MPSRLGPNMAGKSTYMRQTCAHRADGADGLVLSRLESASSSAWSARRVTRAVGASDDLAAGQCTFMVEMSEVADILTPRHSAQSLLILDEIGRGTSTYDGMSHRPRGASNTLPTRRNWGQRLSSPPITTNSQCWRTALWESATSISPAGNGARKSFSCARSFPAALMRATVSKYPS